MPFCSPDELEDWAPYIGVVSHAESERDRIRALKAQAS